MILNDELRELITARAPVAPVEGSRARTNGTRFLRDCALEAVKNGESTLEEINRGYVYLATVILIALAPRPGICSAPHAGFRRPV